MSDKRIDRWEKARKALIHRWENILEKIGERDEAGVLELATVMDEFCDEAIAERMRGGTRTAPAASAAGDGPVPDAVATRCIFCEGYRDGEGCLGVLAALTRAIFASDWEEADRLATDYLGRLHLMKLDQPETIAHL